MYIIDPFVISCYCKKKKRFACKVCTCNMMLCLCINIHNHTPGTVIIFKVERIAKGIVTDGGWKMVQRCPTLTNI